MARPCRSRPASDSESRRQPRRPTAPKGGRPAQECRPNRGMPPKRSVAAFHIAFEAIVELRAIGPAASMGHRTAWTPRSASIMIATKRHTVPHPAFRAQAGSRSSGSVLTPILVLDLSVLRSACPYGDYASVDRKKSRRRTMPSPAASPTQRAVAVLPRSRSTAAARIATTGFRYPAPRQGAPGKGTPTDTQTVGAPRSSGNLDNLVVAEARGLVAVAKFLAESGDSDREALIDARLVEDWDRIGLSHRRRDQLD